jgi:zinc protease
MSGRLFNRLRDKQSLAYSVYAFNEEGMDPGFFGVYIGTAPEKEKAARDGLVRELQLVRDQPISADELQRAQQVLIGDFEIGLQRYRNQAARYALDELYGLGFRYSDLYADKIADVTAKSAQDAARKYIVLNSAVTAVVRPCSPEVGRNREPRPKKVASSQ